MSETMQNECVTTGDTPKRNEHEHLADTTAGKVSGIYKIINKVNGKYYVGSSEDIHGTPHGRWYQHKNHLRNNLHYNKHLQGAWNKYEACNFDFIVVDVVATSNLLEREQYYLDIAKTDKSKCYNKSFIAERPEWTAEVNYTRP